MNGFEVEASEIQMGVTNRAPEFLAKFPLGKVPAFEGADGFCLVEASAIATYIAGSGPKAPQLLGSDMKTKAKIAEWTLFTETELVPHSVPAHQMWIKIRAFDAASYDTAASLFERALTKVEAAVKGGKKYLVGDQLTLADLEVAPFLQFTSDFLFDAEMGAKFPATVEYVKGIAAVPEVAKFFGEFKLIEKRIRGA